MRRFSALVTRNRNAALKVGRQLMVSALFVVGLATSARADTIYTYTGNNFTAFAGGYACSPECGVTGSFTLDQALSANINTPITPISYTFTDGNTVWTSNNSVLWSSQVITDSQAAIAGWELIFEINPDCGIGCTMSELFTADSGGTIQDMTQLYPNGSFAAGAYNFYVPGVWTANSIAATPEPSTVLLLATGLLGLGAMFSCRKLIA